jgi:undecaprenyl phosphate N,N'-diacetylbacillosamine 1-phosphate transferase
MVYRLFLKRIFDIILSIILLSFLSPILVVIIIFLTIANQGTPFFIHPRPGKNAKMFKLIKFKSMNDKADENGQLLPDSQRLTTAGRFIRNTSLDELPQLINVLIGNMSIIGPRPLMEAYLPLYNNFQRRRHDVLPGITGWAQVNGRNAISWKEKFEYDVWYVDNLTVKTDLLILWKTFIKVVKSEGINQVDVENAVAFKGNSQVDE